MIYSGGKISKNKNNGGGSVRRDDIYSGKGEEPVLASLSDSYLNI